MVHSFRLKVKLRLTAIKEYVILFKSPELKTSTIDNILIFRGYYPNADDIVGAIYVPPTMLCRKLSHMSRNKTQIIWIIPFRRTEISERKQTMKIYVVLLLLCLMAHQSFWKFNAQITFPEWRKLYYLTHWWGDKGVYNFLKNISLKVKVIVRLEFGFDYYDVIVQQVSYYATDFSGEKLMER